MTARAATTTADSTLYASSYGVVADCVTRSDGAMTNGSAVLTSAGATFTSADVGKTVVVDNAKGTGTHLYGTITDYTSATQVTLSTTATRTVSAADFTYGTDDTTDLQAAIDAAVTARTKLHLPKTPMLTTATITIGGPCEIESPVLIALNGPNTDGAASEAAAIANGDILAMEIPIVAPYLSSGIVCAAASIDALRITCSGHSVNLTNIGVRFAGRFHTTGHGVRILPPALTGGATGYNSGPINSVWRNVQVYGNDGSHYGFYFTNPLLDSFYHLRAYGGGGLLVETDSSIGFYGNCTFDHFYAALLENSDVHGIATQCGNGSLNLLTFTRPQSINFTTYANGAHALNGYGPYGNGAGKGLYNNGAGGVVMIGLDNERATTGGSGFRTWWFSGGGIASPTGYTDGQPYFSTPTNNRQLNMDGSFTLQQTESASSMLKLLYDVPRKESWGIASDGTGKFYMPGKIETSGQTPTLSEGAAVGTTAPPVIVTGNDFAGSVIFGSGSSPAAGAIASFTFDRAYTLPPAITIAPTTSGAAGLGLYVSSVSTTGFTVSCANAPAASQSGATYGFSYQTVGADTAPVTPIIFDDFNKANSSSSLGSPRVGSAPTVVGTWGIDSNHAYLSAIAGQPVALWESSDADVTVKSRIATHGSFMGVAFRAASTTDFLYASEDGQIVRYNSGWTTIGTLPYGWGTGDTFIVVCNGTSLTFKNQRGTIGTLTSSINQTATKHGLLATNQALNSARWDTFEVYA